MNIKHGLKHGLRPALTALCIGAACSAQAISLVVNEGEIMGVSGVNIQGRLYDVTFVDGSFNTLYPAERAGYAHLAREVAQALIGANHAIQSTPNWRQDLRLHGCTSMDSCTVLIPEHSDGAPPLANMTYAVEVIHSQQQFRSVTDKLWPFHAATDTKNMPDMLYAIITPAP